MATQPGLLTGDQPVEMGMGGQEAELFERLSADRCYTQMFADAFPDASGKIDMTTTTKALAAFERTLVSWNSPYDRAKRGERDAMSDAARHGQSVFQTKGCAAATPGPTSPISASTPLARPATAIMACSRRPALCRTKPPSAPPACAMWN